MNNRLDKYAAIYFLALLVIIYLSAWFIQDQLFLNWDISMLLDATQKLLNGGTYVDDFFNPNPPMIYYLYLPPTIVSHFFALNIIYVFRFYIFSLASLSLFICSLFTVRIFIREHRFLAYHFILIMAGIFLLSAFFEFGQREHLFMMLAMPYLLLVAYRLQPPSRNNLPQAGEKIIPLFIGLYAGLGFALKPYFLCTPLLVELWYIYYKKNVLAWMRPEILSMLALFCVYAITTFIFFPDYIFVIVPYMMRYYYQSISLPWHMIIFSKITLFCAFTLFVFFLQYKENPYKILCTILILALMSFLLIYVLQRTEFIYHKIPVLSLVILILGLSFCLFANQYRGFFTAIVGSLFMLYLIHGAQGLYTYSNRYKEGILNPLIAFMKSHPRRSIYFLSEELYFSYPLPHYTDAAVCQRFDSLWIVAYLVNKRRLEGEDKVRQYLKNDNPYFFLNLISDDLNKHKPQLVFVDVKEINSWINHRFNHFDFLSYFLENNKFKQAWGHYHYLTSITGSKYEFDVYQREEEEGSRSTNSHV